MSTGKMSALFLFSVLAFASAALAREDRGIFEDLNDEVGYTLPGYLTASERALFTGAKPDRDGDGIPDQLDVLLGALKAAANGASYDTSYHRMFDTLPKAGPDHIGVVSSTLGADGLPMVVNNWTFGATTAEMDLLSWCPVTHHFRIR